MINFSKKMKLLTFDILLKIEFNFIWSCNCCFLWSWFSFTMDSSFSTKSINLEFECDASIKALAALWISRFPLSIRGTSYSMNHTHLNRTQKFWDHFDQIMKFESIFALFKFDLNSSPDGKVKISSDQLIFLQ